MQKENESFKDEGKEEDVERGFMSKESWRGSWVWTTKR